MRLQAQDSGRDARVALNTKDQQSAKQHKEQFRNRQRGNNWGEQGRSERNANWGTRERSENNSSRNSEDYYSVIVNNNIFYPLGWKPPNKEPEYTFVGTFVAEDASTSEGYVLEKRSNKFYTAGIGDKIGDAVVTDIKDKEILLDKNGEKITLKAGNMQFLQIGGSQHGRESRGNNRSRGNNSNKERNASTDGDNNRSERETDEQRRQEWYQRAQEMHRRFENASKEDRGRMMREFRERGRFRGRR